MSSAGTTTGGINRHTVTILKAAKKKRPGLKFAVWQMRGPVAPQLAKVYREMVDLVMMETYYNFDDAWMIPFSLQVAQLNILLEKSVVDLVLGAEAPRLGGWEWTRTAEELDEQVRLIRFVAPESPGLAFFGSFLKGDRAMRMTPQELDDICSRPRGHSSPVCHRGRPTYDQGVPGLGRNIHHGNQCTGMRGVHLSEFQTPWQKELEPL